jgi:hypothetical protein
MRKRFFLAAVLATLWTSVGCEAWLHHHGYYPTGSPGVAPAASNCCVPCVPCTPTASYAPAPAAVPNFSAPYAPAAGTCCAPVGR